MDYSWKVIMKNRKEYIVISKEANIVDFFKESIGMERNKVSIYDCSSLDNNGCAVVLIVASEVSSIELMN